MANHRLLPALLLALLALPVGAHAQSPSPSVAPSVQPTDPAPMSVVGPDGLGAAPSPPIGPAWHVGLERSLHNVLWMDTVACGDGFALLVYGADIHYRPHALIWTSPDGVDWSRGGDLRPLGDPTAGRWTVFDLVVFRGALWALGGEDQRLVVWRSGDCGRTWRRLPDRPAFFLGRNAVGLDAIDTAATADTLLVLGRQGGEEIPVRHWAWTMDGAGDWRRIRRGLQRVIDFGLDSDGQRFSAVRLAQVPDAIAEGHLVTSDDGRHWEDRGVLPARSPVIPDVARGRLLIQTEVVGTGWVSPETQASIDGITWTPVVRAAPTTQSSASQLFQSDGVLVWVVDVVDRTDSNAWSWIGVSEDGGVTWTVSAGWPGMRLAGLTSVAASDGAVVLAFSGEQFDGIHLWALPRDQAAG